MRNFIRIFIFTFVLASTQLFGVIFQAPSLEMIEKQIDEEGRAIDLNSFTENEN